MTPFTKLTTKHFITLQDTNYKTAWRTLDSIRDSCGVKVLLVCHLATFWGVDESALIAQLSPKKK